MFKSLIFAFLALNSIYAFANEILHHNIGYNVKSIPLGCDAERPVIRKFTLSSSFKLNQKFIQDKNTEDLYEEAIEFQIKHLMGLYKNARESGINAVLFAYRGPTRILKTDSHKYGMDLQVDRYLPSERHLSSRSYVLKALEAGKTNKNDEAVLISYQTELMVSDCSKVSFEKFLDVRLPQDPFLSLWLEDKHYRGEKNLGPYKVAKASNCSSNEIAMFGDADNSWYFWDPKNSKCKIRQDNYVVGKISHVEEVSTPPQIDKSFFSSQDKIKVSTIFGEISDSDIFLKINYEELRKMVIENLTLCRDSKLVPECLTAWERSLKPQGDKYFEPGTYSYIVFLKMIHTSIEMKKFEILKHTPEKEISLKINGIFRESKMPIELSVYMGRTTLDYGPKATPAYVNILYDGFQNSDVISYVGHAGLGSNLNMDRIKNLWKDQKLKDFRRSKPLWLGLYNCEGVSYFGFDLEKIFKKGDLKVIETFTSGKLSGPQFPLYHLIVLDRIFSDKKVYIKDVFRPKKLSVEFLTETWLED